MIYSAEEIGKRIKEGRLRKNWSQKKLGERLGITGKQVSCYEKGAPIPPIDILLFLCNIFDCELGYLLGEDDYKSGTKLNTAIEQLIGLNTDSINALYHITGNGRTCLDFGYQAKTYRRILNNLLCEPEFSHLLKSLSALDDTIAQKEQLLKNLEKKYGKEISDKAYEYYHSTTDYRYDENAEQLPEIYYHAMNDIDTCLSKEYDMSYSIKVIRYEAREAFERLLDSLYPNRDR